MPQAVAAFVFKKAALIALKAGASKALAVKIATAAAFVAKTGLTLAAAYAVNRALAPDIARPDNRNPMRQATPRRKQGFGRNRATGAYLMYGAKDGDSIDVMAIADHLIAGIDQYWLHDDVVTLGTGRLGSGHVQGNSSTEEYFDAIYIDTRLGAANQSAFTRARSMLPDAWKSTSTMAGVAGLELLCLGPKKERLPKVYPLGLPRPGLTYRGQYCFDWRDEGQSVGTWTGWTPGAANPVLALATKMINPATPDPSDPSRALGWGFDWATDIAPKLSDWTLAVNICDQAVAKKGGGTEPRYECHFEHYNDESAADTLETFLAAMDGWISETGDGALTIKAGLRAEGDEAPLDPSLILDFQMIRGKPRENLKNIFLGFWTDPARKFSRVEAEPWFDAGSIALTDRRETAQIPLEQVQSHGQVRRILKRIALRENAEAFGVMSLDLLGLDYVGERWLRVPADFPDSEFLRGKLLEVRDFKIELSGSGRVVLDWVLYDEDADTWDPASEEGTAPPSAEDPALSIPPIIDPGDVTASVETGVRFGGVREAFAALSFPAPVRSFDLAGAGSVDVPRADLGWMVRWRPQSGGAWTEAEIRGDSVFGNAEDGYEVRLETPALPRAALHVQVAAIGPRDDRGGWSDSIAVDVEAATAPALAAPQNVTASAALEEGSTGAKRPALTVAFDPIIDPQAQLVIIAVKAPGAADSEYAQVDAVEPRLGGKTSFNIPIGVTRDVGLQVWSQWRSPSAWATVEDVVIPGEIDASNLDGRAGSLVKEQIDAARAELDAAAEALQAGAANVAAGIDAIIAGLGNGQGDLAAELTAEKTRVNSAVDDAITAAVEGDNAIATRLSTVAAPGSNLILDARFRGDPRWRKSTATDGFIAYVADASFSRTLSLAFTSSGIIPGEVARAFLLDEVTVSPGQVFEVSATMAVSGVAETPRIRIAWLNAAGSQLSVTDTSMTPGVRSGAINVTAPAGAVRARAEILCGATGSGEGELELKQPLWREVSAGQVAISAFPTGDSPLVSQYRSQIVASARLVSAQEQINLTQENLQARYFEIIVAQTDGGSVTLTRLEELSTEVGNLEASVQDLTTLINGGVYAEIEDVEAVRLAIETLNAIANPTFAAGDRGAWKLAGGSQADALFVELRPDLGNRLLAEGTATASGATYQIVHDQPIPCLEGQRIEWAAVVQVSGPLASGVMRVEFFDADGDPVSTLFTAVQTPTAPDQRIGGFVTVPSGARSFKVRYEATTTGSGAWSISLAQPHAGGALKDQTTLTAFDATLTRQTVQRVEAVRLSAREASAREALTLQRDGLAAQVLRNDIVREAGDQTLAASITRVSTSLAGVTEDLATNYETAADIAATYLAQSNLESSLASVNFLVNATFSSTVTTANDALANAATAQQTADDVATDLATNYLTTAQANLAFYGQAETEAAIAGADLSVNTSFAAVRDTADAALPTANFAGVFDTRFSTSIAALNLISESNLQSALAGADLTVNTTFQNTVNAANAALPSASFNGAFDTRFSTSIAALNLVSQSDLTSALAAIDLTAYTAFNTVAGTANDALPAADFNGVFDTRFNSAIAALNLISETNFESALANADLTVNSAFDDTQAAASLFLSAYTDGAGNALSTFGLEIDVNGRVSGIYGYASGLSSALDFAFDQITFGGVQIFTELNGGLLRAPNIEVENLAADTITVREIVSGSLGERKTAYNEEHAFFNYAGPQSQWSGNISEFTSEVLTIDTTAAPAPGDVVEVRGDHRLETVFNAFVLLTWKHRLIIQSYRTQSLAFVDEVVGRWVPEFFSVAGNTDNLNSYGVGDISKTGRTILRFTVPSDWPVGEVMRVRYEIEAWDSGRGDSRAMHRSSGADKANASNLFLRDVAVDLAVNRAGPFNT